jgi:hypothetical protein
LGQSLYHYTTAWTALVHIVPSSSIRLSPFSYMRDPRESHDWYSSLSRDSEVADDPITLEALHRALNHAKTRFKLLSLTQDNLAASLDLAHGLAHPRLWEQYADGHAGVCLRLNRERLLAASEAVFGSAAVHKAVTYRDGPVGFGATHLRSSEILSAGSIDEYVVQHLRGHIDELFFHKLTDWSTEAEYRLLVETDHSDYVYLDATGAIETVICGSAMHEDARKAFHRVCDPIGIEVVQLRWQNGLPVTFREGELKVKLMLSYEVRGGSEGADEADGGQG